MSSYQIIILAAGKGTRMGEADMPKVLFPLDGTPIISHLLIALQGLTLATKPVLVVGYQQEKVREALGDTVLYAVQEQQLGTAHAVMAARGAIQSENIIVLYGDMPFISAASIRQLMAAHDASHSMLSMFTAHVPYFEDEYAFSNAFGRIIRDASGAVVRITELKDATEEEKKITEINPGIYAFNAKWFWDNAEKIQNKNNQHEYYLTDSIEIAIQQGIKVNTLPIQPEEVFGINTRAEWEQAHQSLKKPR